MLLIGTKEIGSIEYKLFGLSEMVLISDVILKPHITIFLNGLKRTKTSR